jgi:uncharacterized protein (UPF0248 family)
MRTSHALILRLLHDPQFEFNRVCVMYVDRGAPADRSTVYGTHIRRLDRGWMEIELDTNVKFIPYHRIRRIVYDGKTLWKKDQLDG